MTQNPLSLLEMSADTLVKAGYSVSRIGIPSLTARLVQQKYLTFQEKYSNFVDISRADIVMSSENEIDLVESIMTAILKRRVKFSPYNISKKHIGEMKHASEINDAIDAIMARRDPRLMTSAYEFVSLKSAFLLRNQ
ncbi:hypothetical protein QR680_009889 [Steinernema hermaphroditum]|uniref:Uncharacterized protein n=1 Tax=Steinernema hermaphroditum TaxID=289476 RepID=A0AA39MA87_9BILA|nr:hypothetical protein QR680_009889 [Steinernema hermaphroditum]